ncbi:MAG TPA: hypothetical protein PLP21_04435 [Pyrinomonadaceae bacterium]|nr:hypothetical protein [Acidobacteriota bacterium]HQZ95540.1 hypothetical protein [Pyrinomonadaceae bacterium]
MSSRPDPWRILRSKTDLAEEAILLLSERDAWQKVYALPKAEKFPQVCFTGFSSANRERLETIAGTVGLEPKDSVAKGLVLLVIGPNAGESKIKKAELQGVHVTDEDGFIAFVEAQKI